MKRRFLWNPQLCVYAQRHWSFAQHQDNIAACVADKAFMHASEHDLCLGNSSKETDAMGIMGELTARLELELPLQTKNWFDGGIDMWYHGYSIDAKAVQWGPKETRLFRWSLNKSKITADIFFISMVDYATYRSTPLGWVWREEVLRAPIQRKPEVKEDCYAIPYRKFHTIGSLRNIPRKPAPSTPPLYAGL